MPATALIVIDMLNDFVNEDGVLYVGGTVKNIIPTIQKKISQYRKDKNTIIYVCDSHDESDSDFERYPPHCIVGSKNAEIYKDLRPEYEDIIVPKKRLSAFYNTDLEQTLKRLNINKLELCGVCTNASILFSAADARMRGYEVVVDKRCVDSFDKAAHEFALKEMERVLNVEIVS